MIPNLEPVSCFPTIKEGDQLFQFPVLTISSPHIACLAAPSIKSIAISAVASDKTSGVFVTRMFFFLRAPKSQWSTPTE